jgi:hypothetical protein
MRKASSRLGAKALECQGRYSEAIPLSERSLAILEKALGPDHRDVALALSNLAELYRIQGYYNVRVPWQALACRHAARLNLRK